MLPHASSFLAIASLSALAVAGCAGSVRPPTAVGGASGSPLGPSYVLIPLPSDDESLLGRTLTRAVEPGHALDEVSSPNPCADKLAPRKEAALANTFEDAQDLTQGAKGSAVLGIFGFSADANQATHLVYKLSTEKTVSRRDTPEYTACCAQKGCGYGYVSALVKGDGEYASAEEGHVSGGVTAPVGGISGNSDMKILHKRKVKGFIAALVTITDESKRHELGPLGELNRAGAGDASVSQQAKQIYELDKINVDGAGERYVFREGRGTPITENEFVRRYHEATGQADLDDMKRRRNVGRLIAPGILFTGASVGTIVGITGSKPAPVIAGVLGVPAVVAFGLWFFVDLGRGYDGSASSHDMDDRTARIYAEKLNRALLRRAIQDVQKSRGDVSLVDPDEIAPPPLPARAAQPTLHVGSGGSLELRF